MKKLFLAGVAALSLLNAAAAHADFNESNTWQCGNVKVRQSLHWSDETEVVDYVVTGIEKSNNAFRSVNGSLYLNGKLCWPVKPVTCLKVDGTTEPCISRQTPLPQRRPDDAPEPVPIHKTVLYYEPGGELGAHIQRSEKLAASGDDVEVRGTCGSGCTMIMAYVPRERICFGSEGALAFHAARDPNTNVLSVWATRWMVNKYPADIRAWIESRGGADKMTIEQYWTLPSYELWAMGYQACKDEPPPVPMTVKQKWEGTWDARGTWNEQDKERVWLEWQRREKERDCFFGTNRVACSSDYNPNYETR